MGLILLEIMANKEACTRLAGPIQQPPRPLPNASNTMTIHSPTTELSWVPDTSITDLPPEILCEIFIAIKGEFSKTLWSLCLTCKLFRDVVEAHCEPEYNLRGKFVEDAYELMLRVKRQPRLRELIRVVRVDRMFCDKGKYTEKEMQDLLWFLIQDEHCFIVEEHWDADLLREDGSPIWLALVLPHVETIELSTAMARRDTYMNPALFLILNVQSDCFSYAHSFDSLRHLSFSYPSAYSYNPGRDFYFEDRLPDILLFPKLRSLKMDNVLLSKNHVEGWSGFEKLSSVTELHIEVPHWSFDKTDPADEWLIFKALKKLVIHIEWCDEPDCASRYVHCLAPQKHSLETLQVYSNRHETVTESRENRIANRLHPTMKSFVNLKHLALTDILLMQTSADDLADWDVFKTSTLEYLASVFPSSLESFTHVEFEVTPETSQQCKEVWASATREQFPSLKTAMLQEYGVHGLSEELEVIWRGEDQ